MVSLRTYKELDTSHHTLVLIHAFPLSSVMYDSVAEILSLKLPTLNIILVDLPGFGKAAALDTWSFNDAMISLHQELVSRGLMRIAIGGTSMGGYAAFAYYKEFPEHVTHLILSNTKAEADTAEGKAGREVFATDVLEKGYEAVYMRMLNSLTSRSTIQKHPEMLDRLRTMISSSSPQAIAAALRALANRDDSTNLLTSISIPTLVITGEGDELIKPDVTKVIADKVKNSTFLQMREVGHLAPLEAPEEWAKIVADFLT